LIILDRWAERHFPELDAARERYDAKQASLRSIVPAEQLSTTSRS